MGRMGKANMARRIIQLIAERIVSPEQTGRS
jgi:hypothetical protein